MFKKIVLSLLAGLIFTGKILSQSVDYYLPYPGILPDHPLYWLKMVRDRASLIVTPQQKKAEKLLLYADKRLGAAWALMDGNKQALGVSTLTKAEKYLEQTVSLGGGGAFADRLGKAVLKHEEVVRLLKFKAEAAYQPALEEMLVKLNQFKQKFPAGPALTKIEIEITEATTAFAALEQNAKANDWEVMAKNYDFGTMVTAIGGVANTKDTAWIFYVNGKTGDKASDRFKIKSGDKVEWKYEAVKP